MTLKVISRSSKLKSLNFGFFLIFMQLLIQNCTKMAPFIQVLYYLVTSISCFHRTVYSKYSIDLKCNFKVI